MRSPKLKTIIVKERQDTAVFDKQEFDMQEVEENVNLLASPITRNANINISDYVCGTIDPAMQVAFGDACPCESVESLFGLFNTQTIGNTKMEDKMTSPIFDNELLSRRNMLREVFSNRCRYIMQILVNNLNNELVQIMKVIYPSLDPKCGIIDYVPHLGYKFTGINFETFSTYDNGLNHIMVNDLSSEISIDLYTALFKSISQSVSKSGREMISYDFNYQPINSAFARFHDSLNVAIGMLMYEKINIYKPNGYPGMKIQDDCDECMW